MGGAPSLVAVSNPAKTLEGNRGTINTVEHAGCVAGVAAPNKERFVPFRAATTPAVGTVIVVDPAVTISDVGRHHAIRFVPLTTSIGEGPAKCAATEARCPRLDHVRLAATWSICGARSTLRPPPEDVRAKDNDG
jgi:hypothetical protein